MTSYQAVQAQNSHESNGGGVHNGGSGLAGCARNGDVQLRCYLFFYMSILEDFSHADE